MDIKKLQNTWNQLGKRDAFWSILTGSDKKDDKWNIEEFFSTGRKEITSIIEYLKSLRINIQYKKALDFGCGVGRLTQALGYYFDEVYGVDISPSMIELAEKYNSIGKKCKYSLNDNNDLHIFHDNTFDFIYSNLVLQHMKSKYSKKYIKEFIRILLPHGILIFQQPSREKLVSHPNIGAKMKILIKKVIPSTWVDLYRNKIQTKTDGEPKMEMYEIRKKEVLKLLKGQETKVIEIIEDPNWSPNWVNFQYVVTKE